MQQTEQQNPGAATLAAIAERRQADPLIGAKIGGQQLLDRLVSLMKNERGVHAESLLCALGSLAGYACQAGLRAQAVQEGQPETAYLVTIDTADGRKFYFGDRLNELVLQAKYSVWGLAAGGALQHGGEKLPDVNELFAHVSKTVGTEAFGQPRFVEGHSAADKPVDYVKFLWPKVQPMAEQVSASPSEWPIMVGIAIQHAIGFCASVVPPELALSIVMESAVPMSKIDLATA